MRPLRLVDNYLFLVANSLQRELKNLKTYKLNNSNETKIHYSVVASDGTCVPSMAYHSASGGEMV